MAIVLDKHNEIKTTYKNFIVSLCCLDNGLRCCLDTDLIFNESGIGDFKLVPLDNFSCKRTIVGTHGTKIGIESKFGLTKDDFIDMEFQEVELQEKHKVATDGLLISRTNSYFGIVNALAEHFGFVGADNDSSFVINESELSKIKLVPFNLKFVDNHFVVSGIEDEMNVDEYDGIVEQLYCSDYAL